MKRHSKSGMAKELCLVFSTLLLASCKVELSALIALDTASWKNADTGQNANMPSHDRVDVEGNTWQAINSVGGSPQIRLVDSNGAEQWRLTLDSTVSGIRLLNNDAVVLTRNNRLQAVTLSGEVEWQTTPIAVDPDTASISVSHNGNILVAGSSGSQVRVALLNSDGVIQWTQTIGFDMAVSGSRLTELGDGNVLLLVWGANGSVSQTQILSGSGAIGTRTAIPATIANRLDPFAGGAMSIRSTGALGFDNNGGVIWEYAPAAAVSGSVRCSELISETVACTFRPADNRSVVQVDWLATDGSITHSRRYDFPGATITQSDSGQLVLKGYTEPKLPSNTVLSALSGVDVYGYANEQLMVIDADGNLLQDIQLYQRRLRAYPQVASPMPPTGPYNWEWVTQMPAEYAASAYIRQDKIIVTGYVETSVSGTTKTYNQVSAYPLAQ